MNAPQPTSGVTACRTKPPFMQVASFSPLKREEMAFDACGPTRPFAGCPGVDVKLIESRHSPTSEKTAPTEVHSADGAAVRRRALLLATVRPQ